MVQKWVTKHSGYHLDFIRGLTEEINLVLAEQETQLTGKKPSKKQELFVSTLREEIQTPSEPSPTSDSISVIKRSLIPPPEPC